MIKLGDVAARLPLTSSGAKPVVLANTAAGKVRETYPVGAQKILNIASWTNDDSMFKEFPISYVFGGQFKYPSRIISGLYQASPETTTSSQFRLAPIQVSGNVVTLEVVVDQVTPNARPSAVVIASTYDVTTRRVELVYGATGSAIVVTANGTELYRLVTAHPIANNDKITVVRVKSMIQVFVNGIFIYSGQNSAILPVTGQSFVGMSSASIDGQISTSVKSFNAEVATDIPYELLGRMEILRVTIAQGQWTRMGYIITKEAGPASIDLIDCKWETDGVGDRAFSCDVPGTPGAASLGTNGGSKSFGWNLPANATVSLYAYSNQGYNPHKTIKSGVLQVRKNG